MAKKVETPEPELWERQEEETPRAYEAFCVYRDQGPGRSLRQTGRSLNKNLTTIAEWSSKYEWVKRCAAFDAENDRIARLENLKDIKDMRKRHAELARKTLEKVNEALEIMVAASISNSDVARLMDAASKLERLSRGDVGDVIEERDGGAAVNPVQIYIPSNSREKGKESFDDIEV